MSVIEVQTESTTVDVLMPGPRGPKGDAGTGFTHFLFPTAALSWTIAHNLGHYPASVLVQDPNGVPVIANVSHTDVNTSVVTFASPFAGSAWVA